MQLEPPDTAPGVFGLLGEGLNDHKTVEDDECWYSNGDKKSDLMIMSLNQTWGSCVDSERGRGVERDGICAVHQKIGELSIHQRYRNVE